MFRVETRGIAHAPSEAWGSSLAVQTFFRHWLTLRPQLKGRHTRSASRRLEHEIPRSKRFPEPARCRPHAVGRALFRPGRLTHVEPSLLERVLLITWLAGYAISIVVQVVAVWSQFSHLGRLDVAFRRGLRRCGRSTYCPTCSIDEPVRQSPTLLVHARAW